MNKRKAKQETYDYGYGYYKKLLKSKQEALVEKPVNMWHCRDCGATGEGWELGNNGEECPYCQGMDLKWIA
jgi:rubrerythrin